MSAQAHTPPSSQGEFVTPDAQNLEASPKGTKRQRSESAPRIEEAAKSPKSATGLDTPEEPPNKTRRKVSALAEEDAAIEGETRSKENVKVRREAAEAVKRHKQEAKAALKAAKRKEREDKKARDAAEKKRKQEQKAALKAARDREKDEKKQQEQADKKNRQAAREQKKRWKQEWEAYCVTHSVDGATVSWPEDEELQTITQTDAGQLYSLKPHELACLRHHPRVHFKFGNTTKLFSEEEVKRLAFRKYATLAGVQGGGTAQEEDGMIARGKALWEMEGARLGARKTAVPVEGGLASDVGQGVDGNRDVNWWRDPRCLRALGYESGKLPTVP